MKKWLAYFVRNQKGDLISDVLLFAFILVFVIFPVVSVVFEKYIAILKGQQIQDAIDITNTAVYNSLNLHATSIATIDFNNEEALNIYKELLAENLKLKSDLTPTPDSIAEDTVVIEELNLYIGNFPTSCSGGKSITRPTIHAVATVPVRPSLYRAVLLRLMGKEFVELRVHVDTELPLNN